MGKTCLNGIEGCSHGQHTQFRSRSDRTRIEDLAIVDDGTGLRIGVRMKPPGSNERTSLSSTIGRGALKRETERQVRVTENTNSLELRKSARES